MNAVRAWSRHEPYVDVEKLTDARHWRIRVGRWRALLDRPEPDVIRVLRVLDRKDAYRR
ncbi:MAG: type II toxin-antitoxin system RelE family toxin [Vulcanimicrobiaceae bacterium]